jgi:hypothetical protein
MAFKEDIMLYPNLADTVRASIDIIKISPILPYRLKTDWRAVIIFYTITPP